MMLDFDMTRVDDARIVRADVVLVMGFVVNGGGEPAAKRRSLSQEDHGGCRHLWRGGQGGCRDEAMKEMEISMEDVGKGVGGETTRGGNDTTQTRRW